MQTRLLWTLGLLMVLVPSTAGAELVTFRGGRVMSVKNVSFDGDAAVLVLRTGGEIRMPRDFVLAVAPDEVPHPEPVTEKIVEVVPELEPAPGSRESLVALVDEMAARHGVDPRLANALVQVESNYESTAVSSKGARGLMQLMPATARYYGVDDSFDPVQNLDAGLRHLRGLLDRYGEGRVSLALAAYNAGEGAVSRYRGVPPYRETQDYVRRILTLTGR